MTWQSAKLGHALNDALEKTAARISSLFKSLLHEAAANVRMVLQHWSSRLGYDKRRSLWGGFCVRGEQQRIWFAGDTGYCPVFKEIGERLGPFNLAFIPIGNYIPANIARYLHCSPSEAVQIHQVYLGCHP